MSYTPTEIVHVFLHDQKIGRLALIDRQIFFEYEPGFITNGLEISPYKLPLKSGATKCDDRIFDGLFGVFNDSLPDGWGRLLLDRQLRKHGVAPKQLTPLDRLTQVGRNGMGALSYEPDLGTANHPDHILNLDQLAAETQTVLEGDAEQVFPELITLAGSSAGARPKVMVGVRTDRKHIIHGQQDLPEGFEHWMVKFPSSNDPNDIGAIEYAYSLMARSAGIDMPDTHLFPASKGPGYFGIKRFDRDGDDPLHMHSLCGFLHADHRYPSLDYLEVLKATWMLTKNLEEAIKMFRLTAFNVFAHNRDDHSKNFSYLMLPDGSWQLSPAYDLTFSFGPGGEHSTTVMGEGKQPGKTELFKLAEKFDLKNAHDLIEEVLGATKQWPDFSDEAGVSSSSKALIQDRLASL